MTNTEMLEKINEAAESVINIARTVALMVHGNTHVDVLKSAIAVYDKKVEEIEDEFYA